MGLPDFAFLPKLHRLPSDVDMSVTNLREVLPMVHLTDRERHDLEVRHLVVIEHARYISALLRMDRARRVKLDIDNLPRPLTPEIIMSLDPMELESLEHGEWQAFDAEIKEAARGFGVTIATYNIVSRNPFTTRYDVYVGLDARQPFPAQLGVLKFEPWIIPDEAGIRKIRVKERSYCEDGTITIRLPPKDVDCYYVVQERSGMTIHNRPHSSLIEALRRVYREFPLYKEGD